MKQSLVDLPTTSSDCEQRKRDIVYIYRLPEVTQIMPVWVKEAKKQTTPARENSSLGDWTIYFNNKLSQGLSHVFCSVSFFGQLKYCGAYKSTGQGTAKFTRFRFVEVLFHVYILLLLGKENHSLYRGPRYIEVHYIYVPLYNCSLKFVEKTNYKAEICEFLCYYRKQRGLKC